MTGLYKSYCITYSRSSYIVDLVLIDGDWPLEIWEAKTRRAPILDITVISIFPDTRIVELTAVT